MLKKTILVIAAIISLTSIAVLAADDLRLPMGPRLKGGVYVDFMHSYGFRKLSILQNTDKALGPEKVNVAAAWSLGDGYIVVGYTKGRGKIDDVVCFQSGPEWDIAVHEPKRDNKIGSIELFIAKDKKLKSNSPWFSLGVHYTSDPSVIDNYLMFSIKDATDHENKPVKLDRAFWVKIQNYEPERNEDGTPYQSPFHAGFDVSAVKLHYPCEKLLSGVEKAKAHKRS